MIVEVNRGCPPTVEWQKTANDLGHSSCPLQPLGMPTQTRPDLPTNLLKPLAFLTLIVTDSRASPISQSIGAREMGTTSPNEGLMTIKVRSPAVSLTTPESGLTSLFTVLEHLGMAVCCCSRSCRLFRLHMEVRSD